MAWEKVVDDPLPTDPRPVPQPPGGSATTWGELRELLLGPGARIEAIDEIWRWLIERARLQGPAATLACASLAAPMLARVAGKFAAPYSTDRHDVESEILTALLTQLPQIDLDRPMLWLRLRWAALTAAWQWTQQRPAHIPIDETGYRGETARLEPPSGHPELVLADAVAEGVITADAAELIAATRWEHRSVTSIAGQLRGTHSHWAIRKQRQRAEHALVPWLATRIADAEPVTDRLTATRPPTDTPPSPAANRNPGRCGPTRTTPTHHDHESEEAQCA